MKHSNVNNGSAQIRKNSNNTQSKFLFYYEGTNFEGTLPKMCCAVLARRLNYITLNYVNGQLRTLSQYVPYIEQQISLIKVSTR